MCLNLSESAGVFVFIDVVNETHTVSVYSHKDW